MAQAVFKSGTISLLLTQAIGSGWGPPTDYLDAEAIVKLQGGNESFGMQLRAGDNNLSANLAMLALLRDAYVHGQTVHLVGWFDPSKTNGRLARVSLTGPQTTALETAAIETLDRDFAEVAGSNQ